MTPGILIRRLLHLRCYRLGGELLFHYQPKFISNSR